MLIENIKEALTSIMSNKMRSLLTMLGIIIGISAVITITTIGSSIKSTLNSTLNSLAGSSVTVYLDAKIPEDAGDNWSYPEETSDDLITQDMVDEMEETYSFVTGISYSIVMGTEKAQRDDTHYANISINAVTPGYVTENKLTMLRGRDITKEDCKGKKRVCIISDRMAEYYFDEIDPIGATVPVECNGEAFDLVVVGIYKYDATLMGVTSGGKEKDVSTNIYMPLQTARDQFHYADDGYDYFSVNIDPSYDTTTASAELQEFFADKYADNENWEPTCYDLASSMAIIDVVINVITVAISGIAAISLIVGGVGVMNIMLVSITERTREIGVRMALGAKRSSIRLQFVIEAIMLCLIGGIIGILIGIGFGVLLGTVAQALINSYYSSYADLIVLSVRPSGLAILLSLFFSMLTGVFFGYYPANKASKMEVIDALRYE